MSNETIQEEWKSVKDFPDYEVSTLGNARSWRLFIVNEKGERVPHYFKLSTRQGTDKCIYLKGDGKKRCVKLYRLVAEAFVPNLSGGNIVRHLNDIRSDNRASNLAWGTPADNGADASRNRVNTPIRGCRTINRATAELIYRSEESGSAMAKRYGVSPMLVSAIRKNKVHGFQFEGPPGNNKTKRDFAKITADDAKFIFMSDEPHVNLAERFGLSETHVLRIRQRVKWKHATEGLAPPVYKRGEKTYSTPPEVVIEVFMSPERTTDIAARFGLSLGFVSQIRNRKNFTDLTRDLVPPNRGANKRGIDGVRDTSGLVEDWSDLHGMNGGKTIPDAVVADIFCSKESGSACARRLGISQGHVSLIRSGKTRRDITSKLLKSA